MLLAKTATLMKAGKHGFSGACAPGGKKNKANQSTFSFGIYEWVPRSGGFGLKRGKVKVRVVGFLSAAEAVHRIAEKIAAKLDAGTYRGIKIVRVGTA